MGEAKRREDASQDGLVRLAEAAKANEGKVQLNLHQAMVLQACQRVQASIAMECAQLSELNHKEAAGQLAGAVDFIQKFAGRYLRETQSKIVVPKLELP